MPPVTVTPVYAERLGVPLRWWAQGVMLVAVVWLATVVAVPAPAAWVVTAIALAVTVFLLVAIGSPRVVVADGTFRAGRAHIGARAPAPGGQAQVCGL